MRVGQYYGWNNEILLLVKIDYYDGAEFLTFWNISFATTTRHSTYGLPPCKQLDRKLAKRCGWPSMSKAKRLIKRRVVKNNSELIWDEGRELISCVINHGQFRYHAGKKHYTWKDVRVIRDSAHYLVYTPEWKFTMSVRCPAAIKCHTHGIILQHGKAQMVRDDLTLIRLS